MKTTLALALPLFAAALPSPDAAAQDPGTRAAAPAPAPASGEQLAAARDRLQKVLTATTALPSCGFDATWGPNVEKDGQQGGDGARIRALMLGTVEQGKASGAWQQGALHVARGDDEVLFAGRRMLARATEGNWQLRSGRYANGADLGWLPDPALLLDALSRMELAIVHREVGTLDDRPVEILTATLNQDQMAEAMWSGALPAGSGMGMPGMVRFVAAGGGAGAAAAPPAPPKPEGTVDVAFFVDPATNQLLRTHVRTHAAGGAAGRFAAGGGAVIVVQGVGAAGGEDDEAEEKPDVDPAAPLQFENGLPKRPRKDKSVVDLDVRFRDHGTAKLPALDDRAKSLLGR